MEPGCLSLRKNRLLSIHISPNRSPIRSFIHPSIDHRRSRLLLSPENQAAAPPSSTVVATVASNRNRQQPQPPPPFEQVASVPASRPAPAAVYSLGSPDTTTTVSVAGLLTSELAGDRLCFSPPAGVLLPNKLGPRLASSCWGFDLLEFWFPDLVTY